MTKHEGTDEDITAIAEQEIALGATIAVNLATRRARVIRPPCTDSDCEFCFVHGVPVVKAAVQFAPMYIGNGLGTNVDASARKAALDELTAIGQANGEYDVRRTSEATDVPGWVAAAYVWDRREQYKPSSGIYEALSQIIAGLCRGDHVEAWKHGELDDLKKDVDRAARRRTNSATPVLECRAACVGASGDINVCNLTSGHEGRHVTVLGAHWADSEADHADVRGSGATGRGDAPAVADVGGAAGPGAGPHQAGSDDASGDAGGARVGGGDPGHRVGVVDHGVRMGCYCDACIAGRKEIGDAMRKDAGSTSAAAWTAQETVDYLARGVLPEHLRATSATAPVCQEPDCEEQATYTRDRYCVMHRRCLKCGEPGNGNAVPAPDREKACKPWGMCCTLESDFELEARRRRPATTSEQQSGIEEELDSPNFVPKAAEELAVRGFERVNAWNRSLHKAKFDAKVAEVMARGAERLADVERATSATAWKCRCPSKVVVNGVDPSLNDARVARCSLCGTDRPSEAPVDAVDADIHRMNLQRLQLAMQRSREHLLRTGAVQAWKSGLVEPVDVMAKRVADRLIAFEREAADRPDYPKVEYHYRCPNEHTGVLATLAQSFRCPTCRAEITWQNCSFNGNPVSWRIGDGVSICINLHPSPIDVAIRSHATQKRSDGT